MLDTKVSIIVPIYQVEEYVGNCIKSICNQTFKDFEVILVDDGSTDRSIDIAKEILKKDEINYTIITKKNEGIAEARNDGIRNAKSERVICIDSDDVIDAKTIEILYNASIREDADVVATRFKVVNEVKTDYLAKDQGGECFTQKSIIQLFLKRKERLIVPGMMINKRFLEKEHLFFDKTISFSEDQHFIWRLLLSIDKIYVDKSEHYQYLHRYNSIMTSSDKEKIMTGYTAFSKLAMVNSHNPQIDMELVLARWVMGALHVASKILGLDEMKELMCEMNYRNHAEKLKIFPSTRVRLLSVIMKRLPRVYLYICKYVI